MELCVLFLEGISYANFALFLEHKVSGPDSKSLSLSLYLHLLLYSRGTGAGSFCTTPLNIYANSPVETLFANSHFNFPYYFQSSFPCHLSEIYLLVTQSSIIISSYPYNLSISYFNFKDTLCNIVSSFNFLIPHSIFHIHLAENSSQLLKLCWPSNCYRHLCHWHHVGCIIPV